LGADVGGISGPRPAGLKTKDTDASEGSTFGAQETESHSIRRLQ
jgi:hypothetical protein